MTALMSIIHHQPTVIDKPDEYIVEDFYSAFGKVIGVSGGVKKR
jgi:hypothetical protein